MILTDRIAHAVAAGDVTVTYRRWKHPRVHAGSTSRTVAGIVRIDAIEPSLLDRLDARTPWARMTLARICAEPGLTAAVLTSTLPFDTGTLKNRIRTLKEHGLIRSLPVDDELSAHGCTYLSTPSQMRCPCPNESQSQRPSLPGASTK